MTFNGHTIVEPWATRVAWWMWLRNASCAVSVRVNMWRVVDVSFYTPVDSREFEISGKRKTTTWTRTYLKLLFSPGWRSARIPTLIRLPIVVLLPVRWRRRSCWSAWRVNSPSSSRINCAIVLIKSLELLIMMSGLLCRMDWTISFTSSFNVFAVQSYAFLLRFTKIRALLDWSLNPLSVQRNVPGILVSTSFFRCSHAGRSSNASASHSLICSSVHPIHDKDLRCCSSLYHLSRIIFISAIFLFRAFLNISCALKYMVCRIDVPCLAPWEGFFLMTEPGIGSTPNLSCRIFLCSSVDSFLEAAGIFHMCIIRCQLPSMRHNSGMVSSKKSRRAWRSPYCHIGDQVLRLFTEWIGLLSFVEVLQQQVVESTVSLRFVSTCWMVEWGIPGILQSMLPQQVSLYWYRRLSPGCSRRVSSRSEWQVSLYRRSSLWWRRPCCKFGVSTTRGNLGDWGTLQYNSSPVFMHTTFSIQIVSCVCEKNDCMWSSLIKLQTFSLSELQIAPIYCIVVRFPCMFVHFDSGFVQIVSDFSPLLIVQCISLALPMW